MFEFKLPDLGEGIHEGELLKWYVKEGDTISEDDPLCDMETDKAAVTIPSPRTGVIIRLTGNPGDTIQVNQVLVVIDEDFKESSIQQIKTIKEVGPEPETKKIAAPATRRLAREMKIDINAVTGTGSAGKVTKEDLEQYEAGKKDVKQEEPGAYTEVSLEGSSNNGTIPFLEIDRLPDYEKSGPVEKESIRSLRKKTAIKTTSSTILVPHVAHMDECDVTELENLRKTFNSTKEKAGNLTLLSFVIKAVSSLLKSYPEFNAGIDPHKMEIVYKKYYNIGFAADTPRGLIVPVINNADQKSVAAIASHLVSLSNKGRDGTITAPELTNGTFTITNVGAIGGTGVVPIINYPESAILGLGRVIKKPIVKDDKIIIGLMLPITLCFDHRIADGVRAALFVRDLKQMLENPMVFMTGV
ncbi:MAG: dihydrolipoamide acetyltransferase family protein [Deltaproteobacteria bacterium]|jgi:pyruvate dehydrogenase E2 component (dihydrolipoamide acetyltransferase)|nr:dihydrolipoamide acetyltransferase family protein [Deltaproteobacteria bacterium]